MMRIDNLLNLTIDYVFKRVVGREGSELIATNFISLVLNEKVENINLDCNTFLDKDITDDKVGILDVKAKFDNGVTCDIEMQVVEKNDIYKRLLFYWSKLYIQNIKSGNNYNELKRCIVILIADFELDNLLDIPQYLTRWKIKEEKYGKHVLTDLLEICIIELPKVHKYNENKDLDTWVRFIKNPEVINMASKETTEAINAAKKILEEMSQDEHERYFAELRQKYIMDQKAIADRGLEKGLERGMKKGIEKGIEQVVKNMLKKGVDIDFIMEVTDLSKEKIESLKDCDE